MFWDILKIKIDHFSAIPQKYIKIFAHITKNLLFTNRVVEIFLKYSQGILESFPAFGNKINYEGAGILNSRKEEPEAT